MNKLMPIMLIPLALTALGQDSCDTSDADGDGVTAADGDCDDQDPSTYPGAEEVCDGRDNSCDRVVDNDIRCYGETAPQGLYFPPTAPGNLSWETTSPMGLGWDEAGLDAVAAYAEAQNSTSLIMAYRGRIIMEKYWDGWDVHTDAKIYSAGKTVTAFMAGQAQDRGVFTIAETVNACLGDGWSLATPEQEEAITLTHLLKMTSGLTDELTFEAAPDEEWYYNTPAYYLVQDCLASRAGIGMDALARSWLYDTLGMHDSSWDEPDHQMLASGRDMLRFGLLLLGEGSWGGQPLLSDSAYFSDMLSPSQALNPAYGYLTWLNGQPTYELPNGTMGQGSVIPSGPADLYSAQGAGDKKIYVVPSMELVIIRHGPSSSVAWTGGAVAFDEGLWQRIMAAAP